jgi:hypothetical protein
MGFPTETIEVVRLDEIVEEFPEGFGDFVYELVDARYPSIADVQFLVITGPDALDLLRSAFDEFEAAIASTGVPFEDIVEEIELDDPRTLVAIE